MEFKNCGEETFAKVYKDKANVVRAVLRRGLPALENTIMISTYGMVLSDNQHLKLELRELGFFSKQNWGNIIFIHNYNLK